MSLSLCATVCQLLICVGTMHSCILWTVHTFTSLQKLLNCYNTPRQSTTGTYFQSVLTLDNLKNNYFDPAHNQSGNGIANYTLGIALSLVLKCVNAHTYVCVTNSLLSDKCNDTLCLYDTQVLFFILEWRDCTPQIRFIWEYQSSEASNCSSCQRQLAGIGRMYTST